MRSHFLGSSLVIETPAKLNLSLQVKGRRDDGFHELETVMVSVGIRDTLILSPLPVGELQLQLTSSTPLLEEFPVDERNLVIRAAKLLQSRTDPPLGASIHLHKRIPVQAGMGGGSSDAAATLWGLNRLWKTKLSHPALHELAACLGSDINYFIDSPAAALCTGRGEQVRPIPLSRSIPFVIVKSPSGLSTKEVFANWHSSTDQQLCSAESRLPGLQNLSLSQIGQEMFNSLERPACELSPDVARMLSILRREHPPGAAMTGSGTACFAVCRSMQHARTMAGRLRQQFSGQVWVTTSQV